MGFRNAAVIQFVFLATMLVSETGRTQSAERFSLLIENGRILDGTGNPSYRADVGIVGDTIVAIGKLSGRDAERRIDASGLSVSPGFIDVHTHVDDAFDHPEASAILNYLIQGVTTVMPGADGISSHRIAETKSRWEASGMGTNAVLAVGFNTVRREVMGDGDDFLRPATSEERAAIAALVRQAMEEGAWGVSSGTEYDGLHIHASTEEIVEICSTPFAR